MKKILVPIIIIVIISSFVGGFIFLVKSKPQENVEFSNKFSNLENHILNNSNIEIKNNLNNNNIYVFISICDTNSKAIVFNSKGDTLEQAIENTKNEVFKYLSNNPYDFKWIKLHIATEIEEKSKDDIYLAMKGYDKPFVNGISFDKNFNTALLNEELLCNSLLNDDNELDLSAINSYFESNNKKAISDIPNSFITFDTISFFCDENNNIYDLKPNSENGIAIRLTSAQNISDIKNLISSSNSYLANSLFSDNRFAYGYNASTDKYIIGYSMLRHIGATWSLIVAYENNPNDELKKAINEALSYVTRNVKNKDDNTAYIIDVANYEEDSTINIGGNALACLMLIKYMEIFNTNEYDDLLNDLGNGILSLQNSETGKFTHELSLDFSVINDFVSELYDGESSYALCRLYSHTNNKDYLIGAVKALNYFMENDYYQYSSHWIAYTMNEITKYLPVEQYYVFALKNIQHCVETTKYDDINSTTLELLTAGFETYSRIIDNNVSFKYLEDDFNAEEFIARLKSKIELNLTAYTYPEIAMYFTNPSKFINTFCVYNNNYRIRLDDIQHFTFGYNNYLNTYEQLQKYENTEEQNK